MKDWMIITKKDCDYCDYAKDLLNNHFQDFTRICREDLTEEEFTFVKPKDVKTFPIIYHKGEYFGGYKQLKQFFKNEEKMI